RDHGKIMGGRSVELVREQFALPWVVDQYCDLYKNVLSAESNGGLARPAPSIVLEEDAASRGLGGARR
ncbi:MAG: glycosyltransferase family 1 protein, partial [Mesorhizobium sp.]